MGQFQLTHITKILAKLLCLASFYAYSATASDTSITIYSKAGPGAVAPHLYRPVIGQHNSVHYTQIPGYAMVRSKHDITLDTPLSHYSLTDVASYIDPTTVSFTSLTDPKGTTVLEQNFLFDLVSLNKLATRFIDSDITYRRSVGGQEPDDIVRGSLLSVMHNQLIVQHEDGTIGSTTADRAIFPSLPGEFYTKPTLKWNIFTQKPGKHTIETRYQTDGITWWADYNAIYSDGKTANTGWLDLGAWVSILNQSGGAYEDAKLKLVAGDVHRAPAARGHHLRKEVAMLASSDAFAPNKAGFGEKSFFEFHLYTLGRPTDIPNNSTKQIELFPKVSRVPVQKKMVYYGADKNLRYHGGVNQSRHYGNSGNKKIDVYIEFENDKEHGLGIPLPAGRLRVSKQDDADGSLEFIGEDVIDHTPKNEIVTLKLGSAFDVIGERKQVNFTVDSRQKYITETYEITLRNHKNEPVDIEVREPLYRAANWRISGQTAPYEKIDARSIMFPVRVEKEGEHTLRYTVRYSWK